MMQPMHWGETMRAVVAGLALLPWCAQSQASWRLEETLRIGGAETGAMEFQWIKSIDVDAQGRLHLYNHRTQEIRVFAPDGRHLRTIGRAGSGPGEMRNAEGLVILKDGRIWVRDAANGRYMGLDGEGKYQFVWSQTFCSSQQSWSPLLNIKGWIMDTDCAVRDGSAREHLLLAIHTDASRRVDTLGVVPACGTREAHEEATWVTRTEKRTSYRQIPFAPRPQSTITDDGALWCAPTSGKYEVLRLRPGARDTLRIARELPAAPMTAFERDSIIESLESRGPTGLDFGRLPRTKPALDRLTLDDQGRLWVRRTNGKSEVAFDVWDRQGRLVATVALGAARVTTFAPFVVRGDQVYTVAFDSDDVEHAVRYTIMKPK